MFEVLLVDVVVVVVVVVVFFVVVPAAVAVNYSPIYIISLSTKSHLIADPQRWRNTCKQYIPRCWGG